MIIVTTDFLSGQRITETLGIARGSTIRAKHIGLLLIALLPLLAAATEMYKWVDKDGNVHFSDRPPEEATESVEQLELKVDINERRRAAGQAAPNESQNSLSERRSAQTEAEERRRQRQTEAEKAVAQRQAQCYVARSNLQVLKEQRPMYRFDENGERVFVEDTDREAQIAQYQETVAEFCR